MRMLDLTNRTRAHQVRACLEKLEMGEPLTDEECRMGQELELLGFYLLSLGPEYRHAGRALRHDGRTLSGYHQERVRMKRG